MSDVMSGADGSRPIPSKMAERRSPARRVGAAAAALRARWRLRKAWRGPSYRTFTLAAFASMALVLATAVLADEATVRALRALAPEIRKAFEPLSALGDSSYIFLASAGLALVCTSCMREDLPRRVNFGLQALAARALFVFAVAAASGIAAQLGKHLIGRARPRHLESLGFAHFEPMKLQAAFASFPSGHTITGFAVALAVAYFAPRLRWPLLALACGIAAARLALGSHFPSDVVAGALIGIASATLLRAHFCARGVAFVWRGGRIVPRGGRAIAGTFAHMLSGTWRQIR